MFVILLFLHQAAASEDQPVVKGASPVPGSLIPAVAATPYNPT